MRPRLNYAGISVCMSSTGKYVVLFFCMCVSKDLLRLWFYAVIFNNDAPEAGRCVALYLLTSHSHLNFPTFQS
jgi:hypothetical protein